MDVYEGKEPYIFISYSHKDTERMLSLATELQKHYNVWYDSGIHAGNEWADKVADRLFNCALFLFLVSPDSLASDNCKDELAMARDSGKPFINIRLSDVSFEGGMKLRYGRYQYFDLFKYDDMSEAVAALFKSESFMPFESKQHELRKWVSNVEKMMASTEESSPNLNDANADFMVRFRTVNASVEFGHYLGQPIVWDIKSVNKDTALLVSRDIIDARAFDTYGGRYEESELRHWLNTELADIAFDEQEKRMLCPLSLSGDTEISDKIGLLSYEQAVALYKTEAERIKRGTPASSNRGLISNSSGNGWWWLSSSDQKNSKCVFRVYSNGRIGFDNDFDNEGVGIVPVILVRID